MKQNQEEIKNEISSALIGPIALSTIAIAILWFMDKDDLLEEVGSGSAIILGLIWHGIIFYLAYASYSSGNPRPGIIGLWILAISYVLVIFMMISSNSNPKEAGSEIAGGGFIIYQAIKSIRKLNKLNT